MSAPLDSLRGDFPLRPRLAGALVPQNVNLWMGHTKSGGSSSGLHHDFHDNLYVLLRGKKTFRCEPRREACRLVCLMILHDLWFASVADCPARTTAGIALIG